MIRFFLKKKNMTAACTFYNRARYNECRLERDDSGSTTRTHAECMLRIGQSCNTAKPWFRTPDVPDADHRIDAVPGMWGGGGQRRMPRDPHDPEALPYPYREECDADAGHLGFLKQYEGAVRDVMLPVTPLTKPMSLSAPRNVLRDLMLAAFAVLLIAMVAFGIALD